MTLHKIIDLQITVRLQGYTETFPQLPPGDLKVIAAVINSRLGGPIIEHVEFVIGTAIRDVELTCTVTTPDDRILKT